jgi:hypothetical protein
MSFQLSSGDRKILLIAAVFLAVLILGALLFVSPQSNQSAIPTTYSSNSNGAKAAYLLLQETGYRIERWEQSPAEIKSSQNNTFILVEPSQYANKEEQAALHQFIRQGGRLIAIGQSAAAMLPANDSNAALEEEKVWEKYSALAPSFITQAAPQITMAPATYWDSPYSALALYGKNNRSVVVRYAYGKGTVIWWAAATPLTNAGLKEPGNLEFFIACLGNKATARILWDEYFHGYSRSDKGSFETTVLEILIVQLVLVAAAVLWTFSRRSGPIRPSFQEIRLSPLEFVETLGGLYEHARASAVAVDIHYQRFLYWLTKRLGMSRNSSIEEFEKAMRNRWNFHDAQFAAILKECGSARYLPDLPPGRALKLVRSLHSYAVQLKLFPASTKESNPWKPSRNY